MKVRFADLEKSDLYVDCIYKGGSIPNMSSEPFHKLIPGCENAGGFRKKLRADGSGKYAYVVLYTSMEELEWPDFLDEETGIFRYYGDNLEPGRELRDTKKKGNVILENSFALLNEGVMKVNSIYIKMESKARIKEHRLTRSSSFMMLLRNAQNVSSILMLI